MAGQVWGTAADGGYMYSDELSTILRMEVQPQTRYRQHCDAKDAMDKGYSAGDKFHWNVYSDVAAQGTALTEGTAIPETKFTITQGELTVTEYGNSVPYSSKLDDLSLHPVKEVIKKVLKNDASKMFDIQARAQFDASPLTVASATATDAVGFLCDADKSSSLLYAASVNGGGTEVATSTGITWADTEEKVLRVQLNDEGDAYFWVDGELKAIHQSAVADVALCAIFNGGTRDDDGANTIFAK